MSTTTAAASSARTLDDDLVRPDADDEVRDTGERDDLDDRIGETIRDAEEASRENGDPAPDSMQAMFRLQLPAHTFFEEADTSDDVPDIIKAIARQIGRVIAPTPFVARWSTPEGMWVAGSLQCDENPGQYHFYLAGPDTKFSREHLTVDEAIKILTVAGVIRP